jgi:signal transduction histidine kinase
MDTVDHELPRIFERFHRVEGVHGRSHEGTGIGLALTQELVKLHGGTIKYLKNFITNNILKSIKQIRRRIFVCGKYSVG